MNLFEKLNRLDDSLVESKRVIKKKNLTESVEDVNRRKEFLESVFAEQELIDIAEVHTDFKGRTYKEEFNYILNNWDDFHFEDEYEAFCEDELDDDIDEMLTESEEKYDLSTLVKDSINHLVNDLGKDPMTDDFGDDVCADLENNYDIEVPQNMVKYADWCDAVMSEVSRQLNNKEELTESKVFDDMQGKIEDALASNKSLQFLIEPCSDGVLVRFLEGEKNAVLDAVDKLDNKGFDISPAGQEFDFNFIVKGFTEQGAKQLTI